MRHGHNSRRPRGRNGGHGGGHSGGHHHHGGNNNSGRRFNPRVQTFDSNGPDVRIRGNAFQITEKYTTLARDASASGDRILAESYLQHAEHYQRMLNEAAAEFGDQSPQPAGHANSGMEDAGMGDQPEVSVQPIGGAAVNPGDQPQPMIDGNAMPQAQSQGQPQQGGGYQRHHRHQRPQHHRSGGHQQQQQGQQSGEAPAAEAPVPEAETA